MVTFPAKKLPGCNIPYSVPLCSPVDFVLIKLGPVATVTIRVLIVHFNSILSAPRSHLLMSQYQHLVWRMCALMPLRLGMHFRVQWIQGFVFYGGRYAGC
jgi:hypothetical protein